MSTARPRSRAIPRDATILVACALLAGIVSVLVRQDANWDLQNYHYYDPWAWVNGRLFGTDVGAAQLQTFHNPLLDVPFYAMVAWDWPPRLIAFVLGISTGVAGFFLFLLLRLLFTDLPGIERRVAIGSALAIGLLGAMGRATIGTTMNEWPIAALTMVSLWLVVRALVQRDTSALPRGTLLVAGAILGIATGAKLTAGTFAVAMCAAVVLRGPVGRAATFARVREAVTFGCGVLAGFAVAYAPWGISLWIHYGSPIFPYGNEWIQSPWWANAQVIGRRYGPHALAEWLRFPFDLYSPKPFFVSEIEYRDVRMPVLYGLAIACGFVWLWVWGAARGRLVSPVHQGVSRAWRFVVAFFMVAFLLWTAQHSVYRYFLPLELLTGALLVTLVQRNLRPGYAPPMMIVLAVLVVALTQRGSWGRVNYGDSWFDVRGPQLDNNALVVMATDAPMAHVIPFLSPVPVRAVGIDNGIINAGHRTLLEGAVNDAIRRHDGPIYALSDAGRDGAAALAARGLARVPSTCAPVRSNLISDPLTICRVVRASDVPPAP